MKVRTTKFEELISPLKPIFQKENFSHEDVKEKPPLRSELFTIEQLEQHAQQLANTHQISYKQAPEQLLKRLSDNEDILFNTIRLLQQNIKEKKSISPAAEWLLDNFYLIEEEILIGKRYLPKGYSKGLPRLSSGKHEGFPRVYDIAIEIISHSDGHVDINSLSSFISAYQKINYLTLGELWAVPIMIRLALLENLSRVAIQIALDRNDSALANQWANTIIETSEKNPKDLVLIIADMARSKPPMTNAFVGEFARKLQWKGSELSLPITWLEQHLSGSSDTLNSMVLAENQTQAANQVSVSNSINSLRFIAKMEWREFVETMSIVEHTLKKDIDSVYSKMDFYTRDHYRHVVEKIAKESDLPEHAVAQIAIDLAQKSFIEKPEDKRRSHVGYYLIDKGRTATEKNSGVKLNRWQSLKKLFQKSASGLYIISASFLTLVLGGFLLAEAYDYDIHIGWLIALGLFSVLGASQLAIALTNWWATLWVKPNPLPRLNFAHGIPNESRTMVVIPTLLANPAQIEKLVEDLEVRYLSNKDNNLTFALLTDFRDAQTETLPEDHELVNHAAKKIEELNLRYGKEHNEGFFLFHRPRRWNPVDKVWMGYERKRGKLSELNHLLRGKARECFSAIIGDERLFETIKYIITLDTDTQLPRDAGWKLAGLMAHPMNQPVYDEKKKRVIEGYGIIQPRIAISLQGATRTGYSKLHENDSGIDPYTRVTSDVYQDVFKEGSFIGKGIYDIDTFDKALNNRFPENRILSHDLLEGSYTRCAFASDVQLYEEYPSHYSVDVMRRHRWIRGDWQIGTWFLPIAPDGQKKYRKNSISALSRWKIFDNLRRSIVPIAQLLLLLAVWIILPAPIFWTFAILAILFVPPIISSLWSASQKPKEIAFDQHLSNTLGVTNKSLKQALFTLICLPYEAYLSMDAIVRTLWRMYISRKRLLEWNPSNLVQKKDESAVSVYRTMWIAPLLSIAAFLYLGDAFGLTLRLFIAAPFLVLWLLSPVIVYRLNKPVVSKKTVLSEDQKVYLRELSRKTWSFFEVFVNEGDNWLPPDNLQQYPIPVIAHRTSPTNIGMSLLANLSAYDFGYITPATLLDRTQKTFSTLHKLDRQFGHFYNWYDTQSLRTLNPRYISTVDSGNFAGHLLTLRQGLIGLIDQKVLGPQIFKGLQDTLYVLRSRLPEHKDGMDELEKSLSPIKISIPVQDFYTILKNISDQYTSIKTSFQADEKSETGWWIASFETQINLALEELTRFVPWSSASLPEKFITHPLFTEMPTLASLTGVAHDLKKEENLEITTIEEREWLGQLEAQLSDVSAKAQERINLLRNLAQEAFEFADLKYDFLYDKAQRLLSIGFNADDSRLDASYYDLLASEARLSSFVAIAHKDGMDELEKSLSPIKISIPVQDFYTILKNISDQYTSIKTSFQADEKSETGWWIASFETQINLALEELTRFVPWSSASLPEKFITHPLFTEMPTLASLTGVAHDLKKEENLEITTIEEREWLGQLEAQLSDVSAKAQERINLLRNLAQEAFEFADLKYDFLYDKAQRLLSIGFNADDSRLDASYYDLLASEARLSSFVAIAQGKLPQESWFALGRRLTAAGKTPVLLSWSGSMFEYLMPMLVMPNYENTLLDEMAIGTVKKQIEYGAQQNVPWGISESCYNVVDSNLTYQYRAFGVPGLGFKRGLGQDLVIAPYATVMALMVDPHAAYENLQRMKSKGFEGRYGFYEAVDFTPIRLSRGQSHAVIQTFMAHHQGMSLLSLAYLLLNQPMQKRFEADPQFQTALLLLQEQVPKTIGYYSGSSEEKNPSPVATVSDIRVINTAETPIPEVQLLSNGRYHVMLTNSGGGYSRWKDIALTRWREDTTADNWGTFCYVRDLDSNELWSNTHHPTLKKADHYEAVFSQGRVEYRRRDHKIETYTEVIVSPEDDVEVRRIHFINHSKTKRNLELTSYGEVVMAMPAADNSHPAFSNLFIQTEINEHQNAIICSRRARSKDEQPPWMFHLAKINGTGTNSISYETDRNKFIGRGNTLVNPASLDRQEALSGSQGSVLDPIVSIQYRVSILPGETATIDIVTGIASTREANQTLIDKYQDKHLRDRAFELSWTHSQVVLRQIGATESDAQLYGRLASSILYANPALRANKNIVLKNQRGQSALWSYSISGVIILERIDV